MKRRSRSAGVTGIITFGMLLLPVVFAIFWSLPLETLMLVSAVASTVASITGLLIISRLSELTADLREWRQSAAPDFERIQD